MTTEKVHILDEQTLAVFAKKGTQGGLHIKQTGNENGIKVRRIMQITKDISQKPFREMTILDIACAEGVYSIEAGLRGAHVCGIDARSTRMADGVEIAKRLSLGNVSFKQMDLRDFAFNNIGKFDAIYFLGILYHLDAKDIFAVFPKLYNACNNFLIIDTHITEKPDTRYIHDGETYDGTYIQEHLESDSLDIRQSRPLSSIDNPQSFILRKARY